jgi:seryl-tRNA synthetase
MPVTKYDSHEFHEGLVKHGLIIPVGVPGVFGRSAVFEDVLERFNGLVSEISKNDGAEVYTFPPVINRQVLEKVHYLDSFPHLCGAVYSFFGKEPQAKELSRRIHDGEKWDDLLGLTDVVLNPAACYPVYPTMTGTVPEGGRLVTMLNWVFRHEPSPEPTRMQSFRVREFVRIGTPDQVVEWRDMWLQRGLTLLQSLGLPASSEVASDPFFGRSGKMLAVSQKEQRLKFEVVIPVISAENPTAVCSFNFHQEHFGSTFGIRTSDQQVANSACLGFGLERIVMALFKTHGFDPGAWPREARSRLWP